jgi:hypothetical protein
MGFFRYFFLYGVLEVLSTVEGFLKLEGEGVFGLRYWYFSFGGDLGLKRAGGFEKLFA